MMAMMRVGLFLGALLSSVMATIIQDSIPGAGANMLYTMYVSGTEKECAPLHASGNLTMLNITLDFNKQFSYLSYPADLFITVSMISDGTATDCLQYGGYNYVVEGCGKAGSWPSSWNTVNNGHYTAQVSVARAGFHSSASDDWEVCIGNGDTNAFEVYYNGSLKLGDLVTTAIPPTPDPTPAPSAAPTVTPMPTSVPTSMPTPSPSISFAPSPAPSVSPSAAPSATFAPTATAIQASSACDAPVQFTFDANLAGTETVCSYIGADGAMDAVNMTMRFSGGHQGEWASDMALLLYEPSLEKGLQIGGYYYYIPNVEYVGAWPSEWQSGDAKEYTAFVNVSEYGFQGEEGFYLACLLNGWFYGGRVNYEGHFELPNLITNCNVTPPYPTSMPTSVPSVTMSPSHSEIYESSQTGQMSAVSFGTTLVGAEKVCIDIGVNGNIKNVSIVFDFVPTNGLSYASDLMVTLEHRTSDDIECLSVGGYDVKGCVDDDDDEDDDDDDEYYYYDDDDDVYTWSNSLDSPQPGTYSDSVDVSSSDLDGAGLYTVCIVNGYKESQSVSYTGTVKFGGLTSAFATAAPSAAPTVHTKKHNNNDDDEEEERTVAMAVAIPICIIVVGALAVAAYMNRHMFTGQSRPTSPAAKTRAAAKGGGDNFSASLVGAGQLDEGMAREKGEARAESSSSYVPPTITSNPVHFMPENDL